ncbi:uncharacterized protein C8A04DRAFT_32627 [Dichotomopilus funicola]|uniref:Uncharacterized protein n=1 Tax=Dichotomopilus funicola TaxID=1934379 RepID=A0AAN6UW35_9PEZI|nr:hypothetical protein C8A04DRAFT_32627 [Dichotomopilus funicola]
MADTLLHPLGVVPIHGEANKWKFILGVLKQETEDFRYKIGTLRLWLYFLKGIFHGSGWAVSPHRSSTCQDYGAAGLEGLGIAVEAYDSTINRFRIVLMVAVAEPTLWGDAIDRLQEPSIAMAAEYCTRYQQESIWVMTCGRETAKLWVYQNYLGLWIEISNIEGTMLPKGNEWLHIERNFSTLTNALHYVKRNPLPDGRMLEDQVRVNRDRDEAERRERGGR